MLWIMVNTDYFKHLWLVITFMCTTDVSVISYKAHNCLQNSTNYDYVGRLLTDKLSCGQSIQRHSKYSDVIWKKSVTGSEGKCAFEYSLLRGIILFSKGNMLSLKPTGAVGSHWQIGPAWLQLCKSWNSKAEAKSPLSTSGIGAEEMRNLQKSLHLPFLSESDFLTFG